MGDPWAEGINQGVSNYATFYQLAGQKRLRQLQEQETQRKIDEINSEKAAGENLATLVSLRSGKWAGKKPTMDVMSPTGQVNMPQAIPGAETFAPPPDPNATIETPSVPVDVPREPTPEEFQEKIMEQKQSLAKNSPKLFFDQMGLENAQAKMELYKEKSGAQIRRINALAQHTEDMTKWDKAGLGLPLSEIKALQAKASNARLIGDDDIADQYDAQVEIELAKVKNWMTSKNRGLKGLLGKEKKKSAQSAIGKTVVERRKTADGRTLVKYEDGTIGQE